MRKRSNTHTSTGLPRSLNGRWKLLSIAFLVFIFDQISKWLAVRYLNFGIPVTIFPGFDLELSFNRGAAFGFLADSAGWQKWFFITFAIIVSIFIFFWLVQLQDAKKMEGMGLSLILGGAIGNLVDRILYGHVIDFIAWYYEKPKWVWPNFNISDAAICIGVMLVLLSFLGQNNDG